MKALSIALITVFIGVVGTFTVSKIVKSYSGNTVVILFTDTNTGETRYWDTIPYWSPIGPEIWKAYKVMPGDVNNDKKVAMSDVIYLVNYVLKDGPPPMADTSITYSLEAGPNQSALVLKYDGQTFIMPLGEFIAVMEDK